MGAIGAAILGREIAEKEGKTNFKGLDLASSIFESNSFECTDCSNRCEVVKLHENNRSIGCFGDRVWKMEQ